MKERDLNGKRERRLTSEIESMGRKGGRRGTINGYELGGMTVKGENREFCKAGEEFT